MSWLLGMLRRLRVLPDFTADDILNAENEDSLREHKATVEEVKVQSALRRQTNERLRSVLEQARNKNFSGLEKSTRNRK